MLRSLDDIEYAGKTVLLRTDLNVPLTEAGIADDSRITEAAGTLRELLNADARPVVMSHLGRPRGKRVPELSMARVADGLSAVLNGVKVILVDDCIGAAAQAAVDGAQTGQIVLLENLRFHAGEEANQPDFAAHLAALADLYVNDAFSASHRVHASIVGVTNWLPSVAGRRLQYEVERLESLLLEPRRPAMAIIGGSKVKDKLGVIEGISRQFDSIAVGGCVANTLLQAADVNIGKSIIDDSVLPQASTLLEQMEVTGCELLLPIDVITSTDLQSGIQGVTAGLEDINPGDMIVDLGPKSVDSICQRLAESACVIWAGPPGAADFGFDSATLAIGRQVDDLSARGKLQSVVGGGDTIAALHQAGLLQHCSHVSLGGGAFLKWLESGDLPGLTPLRVAFARHA